MYNSRDDGLGDESLDIDKVLKDGNQIGLNSPRLEFSKSIIKFEDVQDSPPLFNRLATPPQEIHINGNEPAAVAGTARSILSNYDDLGVQIKKKDLNRCSTMNQDLDIVQQPRLDLASRQNDLESMHHKSVNCESMNQEKASGTAYTAVQPQQRQ